MFFSRGSVVTLAMHDDTSAALLWPQYLAIFCYDGLCGKTKTNDMVVFFLCV
jgi:hypothetical protein